MFCRTRAMGWDDGVEGAGGCRCFFFFNFGSSTVRAPPYATVFTLSIRQGRCLPRKSRGLVLIWGGEACECCERWTL